MALDTTSAEAILKEYYSNQRVQQLMYADAPLWALLSKKKDFAGDSYPLPMRVSDPQGGSATFTSSQNNQVASNYKKFSLTRVRHYQLASISTEAMLASETNPGAFLQLTTAEIDGAFSQARRRLGWQLYGDGSGAIGAIAAYSTANPAVVTLSNVEDIVKIENGQTLQIRNGATVRTLGAGAAVAAVVIGVDRDNGTFTLQVDNSGNTDTVSPGDTVNVVGDYNACMSGIAAWIPSSSPSSTPFFGVDRTIDSTRLGGVRVTSQGKPIDEALVDGARRIAREGLGNPNYVFTGFGRYASLEKILGARVRYNDVEVAGIAFRGIELSGPQGKMTVLADRDCPENKMYMLDLSKWAYYSLKEPIMFLDQDGNRMLRQGSADAVEVRIGGFGQLGCVAPGASGVLNF